MTTRDFVSTTFCVNNGKILLLHHKRLDMWLPPGGHIDENELPCEAAVREFKEETGLDIELHGEEGKIANIRKLIQPQHIQLEDFEDGHQHIDIIYFGKLKDPNQLIKLQKEEVHNIKWFSKEDLESDEIDEEIRITSNIALEELK